MQLLSREVGILDVRLGDVHVGTLNLLEDEYTEFVISEEYRQRYPRPILGQAFEDDLSRRRSSRIRLLPFFSNLLPRGTPARAHRGEIGRAPSEGVFPHRAAW